MGTETEHFWKAARDARALGEASDAEAARAAIEDLVGVALHCAPAVAARALELLMQLAENGAGQANRAAAADAVVWCKAS